VTRVHKAPDFTQQLAAVCKGGVDVHFDNTAGPISDAVHGHLNTGARIVVSGTASVASWDPPPQDPRVERHLLVKSARIEGFVIFDHPEHEDVALHDLAATDSTIASRWSSSLVVSKSAPMPRSKPSVRTYMARAKIQRALDCAQDPAPIANLPPTDAKVTANTILQWIRLPPRGVIVSGYLH
jgi:hypothetical protein